MICLIQPERGIRPLLMVELPKQQVQFLKAFLEQNGAGIQA